MIRLTLAALLALTLPAGAGTTGEAPRFDAAPGWSFFCTYRDAKEAEQSFVLVVHKDLPKTPLFILPDNTEIPAAILPGTDESPYQRTFHTGPAKGITRMISVITSGELAFYSEHAFTDKGAWRFSAEARCAGQPLAAKGDDESGLQSGRQAERSR